MNRLCVVPDHLSANVIEDPDRNSSRAANPVHVLSVGPVDCGSAVHDALLGGPHFRLSIATDIGALWMIPKQESVHLVILHHTLSSFEVEDGRWFVHEWWPKAIIMVIRSDAGLLHVAQYNDEAARSDSSEILLRTIERLGGTWHRWASADATL